MKTGFRVFLASFVALGLSWGGFVVAPVAQLGTEKQTGVLNSSEIYPEQRPGDATLGLQVYRQCGCAACHTTQLQQNGVVCDVTVTGRGRNPLAVSNLLSTLTLTNLTKEDADAASGQIVTAGGKTEIHIVPTGGDISLGWGVRRSVAEDFLWDYPVQLGDVRVGPDLADVGARLGNADWQLLHLYAPQAEVKDSAMPPFRFLFTRQKIGEAPSSDALRLPPGFTPPDGYEVLPTTRARDLAAYLLSLRADVPLHDAPFTVASPPPSAPKAQAKKQ
ncbi:MAG TPA: cbb3-type cytochrome c oxidase subunit II [Verrucomicrobiae bacterium]|nr:cbb3-type cytochrome c oxidase subunit II [Verrucomicrobiae bacterium]